MVHSRDDDASTEIPGADRLEQEQPVDPTADEDVDDVRVRADESRQQRLPRASTTSPLVVRHSSIGPTA